MESDEKGTNAFSESSVRTPEDKALRGAAAASLPKPPGLHARGVAKRAILAGEEVTMAYVSLDGTPPERQERLKAWGFVCSCVQCRADGLV